MALARAAGYELPAGDDGRLDVRQPLPDVSALTGPGPYVVLHPGASAPARRWPARRWAEAAALLAGRGQRVVLTGGADERDLTATVAAARPPTAAPGGLVSDLGGRTSLAELAAVLAGADAVLVANTGVAHLAAAVGTPGGVAVRPGGARGPLGPLRRAGHAARRPVRPLPGQPGGALPGTRPSLPDRGERGRGVRRAGRAAGRERV